MRPSALLLDVAVVATVVVLLFVGLGAPSLHNDDEARYALAARSMLEEGAWLAPSTDGEPWFNKAPLRIWMTAGLARLGHLDAWTVRLPSAILALGAVAFTWMLGRELYDRTTGRLAAIVLATQLGFLFVHCGRSGEMDAGVMLGWTVIAWSVVRARTAGAWLLLGGAAVGFIAMLKHVAVAAPAAVFLAAAWALTRRQSRAHLGHLAGAFAIALVLALPWHLAMALRYGTEFVDAYLGREVGGRFSNEVSARHGLSRPWMMVKDMAAPWSLLLPFALLARPAWSVRTPRTGPLLLVWIGLVLAAMTAARLGLGWYVLPAAPALSLAIARALLAGRWSPPLDVLAATVLALSPLAAWQIAPFTGQAIKSASGTDLFGVLQGAPVVGLQLVFAAALLALAWRARAGTDSTVRRARVAVWMVLALACAFWPLRMVFDARSDLDLLMERLASRSNDMSQNCWEIALTPVQERSFVVRWSIVRAPFPLRRVASDAPRDPACGRIACDGPASPDGLVQGSWSATFAD